MFSNLHVLFGGGLSTSRMKIFTKIFTNHGGIVHHIKKTIHTQPLHSILNYIIIENKQINSLLLTQQFCCPNIPNYIKVIHCSWIEDCVSKKRLLPTTKYEIDINRQTDIAKSVETSDDITRSSLSDLSDGEKLNRKRSYAEVTPESDSSELTKQKNNTLPKNIAAGVIMYHEDKIFMVQPTGGRGYGIPKGLVDPGESLEDTARREFQEETGISISGPLEYLEGSGDIPGRKRIYAFLYAGDGTEKYVSSNLITEGYCAGLPENAGGRYFDLREALRVVHKNQQKLLHLYSTFMSRQK